MLDATKEKAPPPTGYKETKIGKLPPTWEVLSLEDVTDSELEHRAAYLQALADPMALKILREFARLFYAGKPRQATESELRAALGEGISPALTRLIQAGILTESPEKTLEWEGLDLATMLLLGVYGDSMPRSEAASSGQ